HLSWKDSMMAMALKRRWLQIMLSNIIHAGSCKCTRSYSRSSRMENMAQEACFFCRQLAGTDGLHQTATFQMDSRVQPCAVLHEDTELLRRLSAGGMVALEAKYHTKRLMGLHSRARKAQSEGPVQNGTTRSQKGPLHTTQAKTPRSVP
ncbi:hypothetical protein LSAT2_016441, partial [Lamellibrachia satsuma]